MPEARQPEVKRARQPRHCRHCLGDCPGDCLLGDGQCIHGRNGKRPPHGTWQLLLTRRWWRRLLWGGWEKAPRERPLLLPDRAGTEKRRSPGRD
jgi:hypothetical protein